MSLRHHSLIAWQRADDLFIKLHQLSFKAFPAIERAEVGYCIHVAQRLGYLSESVAGDLETEIKQVGAPLAGLVRSERLQTGAKIVGALHLLLRAVHQTATTHSTHLAHLTYRPKA